MKIPACALFVCLTATSVLADPPGNLSTNVQMSPDTSIDSNDSPQIAQRTPQGNCVQLMERAFYMADPASLDRAMDAHREMEMARSAYQAGDDFARQHHAMRALNDRS